MTTSATLTYWGPFLLERKDERLRVSGHPQDPDPSPLGQSLKQSQECRVAKPSVRRSWLDSGPGSAPELRGREPFVEIEWDEALALVAGELERVRDAHGHEAIFAGSYGWGSTGRFHMPSAQLFRFMRQFGGCTDVWGTYSSSGAEAIVPYIFGDRYHSVQRAQTSWSVIAEHTELFVSFGGLRLSNAQVSYNGQGPHQTRGWMSRARANKLEFLNVSPLRDDIASEFEPRWLHPRPGTDVALMAALIHSLVVNDRHDSAFLATHCHGWEQLHAYLLGKSDGVAKSATWAAGITGLDADTIVALALEMASKRTCVNVTYALQRQHHGEQAYWMAAALGAALGQVGLPGGGFTFPFGSAGFPGNGQANARVPGLPIPKRPDGPPTISVSRIVELLEAKPGTTMNHNGRVHPLPDTRLVYWCGGNIFHHHQDLNRLNQAWQRPETIVVHEPFWTPMAKRADIVLPTTTPLERTDLGAAETLLIAMQPVFAPYADSRDDFAILSGVAEHLGFADEFTEGRNAQAWVEHLYDTFRAGRNDVPSYSEFVEMGTLAHDMPPMGAPRQVFLEDYRADPAANPLPTPSGRIELYSETIADFEYDDCPAHPMWMEPFERLGTAAADKHPLHLVSNQPVGRLHSQYDHGEVSQAHKLRGREVCRMNPQDAAVRGIRDGDIIKLFNDRGACLAAAEVTDAVMPTAIQLSTGAWYDPDEHGVCKHGNPNVLTRDHGTSKLAQGPSAPTCLVQVEKLDGPAPPVTAFDAPEFVQR